MLKRKVKLSRYWGTIVKNKQIAYRGYAQKIFDFAVAKKNLPVSECVKLLHGHTFGNLVKYSGHSGAYKVFSFENGIYKPVRRALAIDKKGILYIGGTKDLFKRLYEWLWMSIDYRPYRHPFGERYHRFPRARKLFPPDSLYVCIIPDEDYFKREKEIKDEYEFIHGEYPCMNRN